jgi:WD40 repeat protein/DNA-binding SARP family transcriptional activator
MDAVLQIYTLGGLRLVAKDKPVTSLETRKVEALLVYVACTARPQPREVLADLLWEERSQERAQGNLRVALASLRKHLEAYVDITRDTVALKPGAPVWLDVREVEKGLDEVQARGGITSLAAAGHVESILDLYQGDFLEGFSVRQSRAFEEWMLREQERLHHLVVASLHDLVEYELREGNYPEGIAHATRLLELDPLMEAAHRQMMQLLAKSGRRGEALAQYETCRQLLGGELGIEPSRATQDLNERIRSGTILGPSKAPSVLRGYRLYEQIGSGSFAAVYRAFQPEVGREVAIKVILPRYANQPDFIRRFEFEAQIIARLEHPHIVPLYDYWREPDGAYLVMRWLRGGSLGQLSPDGPLELERALSVVEQVTEALYAAHQQGIVHRDLKPANILLDESGNAYLSDFGVAKQLGGNIKHTLTGALIGSPAYMAPEQFLDEPATPRSDIYSLGLVIYQMLAGEAPYQVDTLALLIDKHLHEPLPSLASLRPDLPAQVNDVLQQATAKDPERRYPDVLSLARALQNAFSGQQVRLPDQVMIADRADIELHNPYKGLRAFQEADAGDFYGREALVGRLLARLSVHQKASGSDGHGPGEGRFLAVVGPSGSGKSSLVKAGLTPALRAGRLAGAQNWFIVEMLPGTHPLEELEAALLRVAVNPPESLLSQLKEDERGLVRAVKRVLPGGADAELLLIIDQFEETFTLVEDRGEARFFLDSLVAAVSDPRGQVRVVITLRADFYDRPLMIADFSQLVQASTEVVVPLTAEELVAAIREPASKVGARFEEGLVPRIVADVNEQPGALPLLQYSLTELFERREGNLLTKAGYEQIGGVLGALSRRAEAVYQGMHENQQMAARQVFLRLVTLGEGVEDTRRRVLRAELEALGALPHSALPYPVQEGGNTGKESVGSVLNAFGKARLLSFDRDPGTRGPTVEVAHEALLREWTRLRGWLQESREDLRLERLLGQMAADWRTSGEDASFLLRGSRLEFIESWTEEAEIALTTAELDYLQASLAEREARRAEEVARQAREAALERRSRDFLRALLVVMALATAVSLYLTGFAFRQRDSARRSALAEATARREATSRELVRFAETELQDPTDLSFSLALLLAREAVLTTWRADGTVLLEAERVLREAINKTPILVRALTGHSMRVMFAAWSPDGKQIVSAGADATARIWDAGTGSQLQQLNGHAGEIRTAEWSPDGAYIITAGQDKTIRIWDARSGEGLKHFTTEAAAASALWSPDGSRLLVAAGGTVRILDAQTGETILQKQAPTGNFSFAAWSPSGDRFAAADDINTLWIWNALSGAQLSPLDANHGPVRSVQWSHDGRYLVSAHVDNLARIWDVQGKDPPLDLEHDASVQFAAWSPDDSQVATGTADGRITIWDALTGQKLRQWRAHDQILRSLAWSPDGSQILTADGDGVVRIWEAKSLGQRHNLRHAGQVRSIAWSPDGTELLTAGGLTLSVYLWDLKDSSIVRQLRHAGAVAAVAWSPDGSRVATASLGTVFIWDALSGVKVRTLVGHTGAVEALTWSRSGEYLATGGQDRTVRIWDAHTGEMVQILRGHSGAVLSATWSADDSHIVTASADQTARIWDVQNGEELLSLQGHSDRVNASVYSPDGDFIMTASSDHTARLWQAGGGELLRVLEGHPSQVWSAAWSPDGSLVATAGNDGVVSLWDPQTGAKEGEAAQHSGPVWDLAWSPDGTQIASAGQDGIVQISLVGTQRLLDLAETLIRRSPAEFSAEERCVYLHGCGQ